MSLGDNVGVGSGGAVPPSGSGDGAVVGPPISAAGAGQAAVVAGHAPSSVAAASSAGSTPVPVPDGLSSPRTRMPSIAHDAWEVKEQDVQVIAKIGSGNFGDVFRGRLWGSDVAVKLLIAAVVTEEVR